jgi:hypothetical protein
LLAHHLRPNLGNRNNVSAKIDVEGFEIAVLKGARKNLLRNHHVRALVIEVGSDRWSCANNSFEKGTFEMEALSALFQNSFILLRGAGSCPESLASNNLADKEPRLLEGALIYHVQPNEWKQILTEMKKLDADCTFWYSNQ